MQKKVIGEHIQGTTKMASTVECPFCGKNDQTADKLEDDFGIEFEMRCIFCGARGPKNISLVACRDDWNKRAHKKGPEVMRGYANGPN